MSATTSAERSESIVSSPSDCRSASTKVSCPTDAPVDQLGQAIMGAIVLQVLARSGDYGDGLPRLIRFVLTDRA